MPYNPTRALELLWLGTQNPSATFRGGQEDAIRHLADGRGRLLVVQKTGWGKSFVYFIAAKLLREQAPQFASEEAKPQRSNYSPARPTGMPGTTVPPDQALFTLVREILVRELAEPKSEAEVAELLAISKPQAKAWLEKLAQEGVLEKVANPVRYRSTKPAGHLL